VLQSYPQPKAYDGLIVSKHPAVFRSETVATIELCHMTILTAPEDLRPQPQSALINLFRVFTGRHAKNTLASKTFRGKRAPCRTAQSFL